MVKSFNRRQKEKDVLLHNFRRWNNWMDSSEDWTGDKVYALLLWHRPRWKDVVELTVEGANRKIQITGSAEQPYVLYKAPQGKKTMVWSEKVFIYDRFQQWSIRSLGKKQVTKARTCWKSWGNLKGANGMLFRNTERVTVKQHNRLETKAQDTLFM